MRFAVVGCEHAHIGIFIREMLDLGHECAGIYEPRNRELAAAVSEEFRVPIVRDWEPLLADERVGVIGSSAVNRDKIDWIERCEKYGKHVMVDKPAVTNRRDLERLQSVVRRGAIEVGMLLTERFHPAVYTLKQHIDQGALGRLVSIGMRKPHLLNAAARPEWFFSKELCGGIVVDLLVHDIDLLHWLTGRGIARMEGFAVKHILPEHPDFFDAAGLHIVLEGGILAQLYADWHTPEQSWTWGDGRIFATGTKGVAELRIAGDPFAGGPGGEALMLRTTDAEAPRRIELSNPPATITEDFLRRIDGRPAVLTGEDIVRATAATIDADERVARVAALPPNQ
jgi:predicted dehydrogenase